MNVDKKKRKSRSASGSRSSLSSVHDDTSSSASSFLSSDTVESSTSRSSESTSSTYSSGSSHAYTSSSKKSHSDATRKSSEKSSVKSVNAPILEGSVLSLPSKSTDFSVATPNLLGSDQPSQVPTEVEKKEKESTTSNTSGTTSTESSLSAVSRSSGESSSVTTTGGGTGTSDINETGDTLSSEITSKSSGTGFTTSLTQTSTSRSSATSSSTASNTTGSASTSPSSTSYSSGTTSSSSTLENSTGTSKKDTSRSSRTISSTGSSISGTTTTSASTTTLSTSSPIATSTISSSVTSTSNLESEQSSSIRSSRSRNTSESCSINRSLKVSEGEEEANVIVISHVDSERSSVKGKTSAKTLPSPTSSVPSVRIGSGRHSRESRRSSDHSEAEAAHRSGKYLEQPILVRVTREGNRTPGAIPSINPVIQERVPGWALGALRARATESIQANVRLLWPPREGRYPLSESENRLRDAEIYGFSNAPPLRVYALLGVRPSRTPGAKRVNSRALFLNSFFLSSLDAPVKDPRDRLIAPYGGLPVVYPSTGGHGLRSIFAALAYALHGTPSLAVLYYDLAASHFGVEEAGAKKNKISVARILSFFSRRQVLREGVCVNILVTDPAREHYALFMDGSGPAAVLNEHLTKNGNIGDGYANGSAGPQSCPVSPWPQLIENFTQVTVALQLEGAAWISPGESICAKNLPNASANNESLCWSVLRHDPSLIPRKTLLSLQSIFNYYYDCSYNTVAGKSVPPRRPPEEDVICTDAELHQVLRRIPIITPAEDKWHTNKNARQDDGLSRLRDEFPSQGGRSVKTMTPEARRRLLMGAEDIFTRPYRKRGKEWMPFDGMLYPSVDQNSLGCVPLFLALTGKRFMLNKIRVIGQVLFCIAVITLSSASLGVLSRDFKTCCAPTNHTFRNMTNSPLNLGEHASKTLINYPYFFFSETLGLKRAETVGKSRIGNNEPFCVSNLTKYYYNHLPLSIEDLRQCQEDLCVSNGTVASGARKGFLWGSAASPGRLLVSSLVLAVVSLVLGFLVTHLAARAAALQRSVPRVWMVILAVQIIAATLICAFLWYITVYLFLSTRTPTLSCDSLGKASLQSSLCRAHYLDCEVALAVEFSSHNQALLLLLFCAIFSFLYFLTTLLIPLPRSSDRRELVEPIPDLMAFAPSSFAPDGASKEELRLLQNEIRVKWRIESAETLRSQLRRCEAQSKKKGVGKVTSKGRKITFDNKEISKSEGQFSLGASGKSSVHILCNKKDSEVFRGESFDGNEEPQLPAATSRLVGKIASDVRERILLGSPLPRSEYTSKPQSAWELLTEEVNKGTEKALSIAQDELRNEDVVVLGDIIKEEIINNIVERVAVSILNEKR